MESKTITTVVLGMDKGEDSISKILSTPCNVFNARLKELLTIQQVNPAPIDLGIPGELLLNAGIKNLPIQMSPQKLLIKKHQKNHPFKMTSVIDMPDYINNPIAIFKSKNPEDINSFVILTEMQDEGMNIVIALTTDYVVNKANVNSIRSIYPKEAKGMLYWIVEDNLLLRCNKTKVLNWLSNQQSHPTDLAQLIKDTTKIINDL